MSKILKNTTGSPISITDTGVAISASPGSYTIPAQDYLLWRASSDVITYIGSGDLVVNDGSSDLSISDGIDLIKDTFPTKIGLLSGTDLGEIGRVDEKLKVIDEDANTTLNIIANSLGGATTSIFKFNEAAVTSRNEFDLSGTTYTVPSGKSFLLTTFAASYDAQSSMYVRLKKQTGGTGAFVTLFRMTVMSGGQGESTVSYSLGNGINIGTTGDVFKITVESSISKGTIWAEFSGSEI